MVGEYLDDELVPAIQAVPLTDPAEACALNQEEPHWTPLD